jgi:spore germination cell wall hydrolase CwlJ-like protein
MAKVNDDVTDPDEDVAALAQVIYGEAGGDPASRVGVGWVVKNRADKDKSSIKTKANQLNQFAPLKKLRGTEKARPAERKAADECIAIAKNIIGGKVADPTKKASNFHSFPEKEKIPSGWGNPKAYSYTVTLGTHNFFSCSK